MSKWERIMEKNLKASNIMENKIERLMCVDYEDMHAKDKLALHICVKKRGRMIGRYEA